MFLKHNNQRGQAVLIVLLSLSVVLIIVLFIMSRSITDISLSTKDEDSLRAFSAAEAGVERALIIGDSSGALGLANFSASVSDFAAGESEIIYPISLKSGENAVFWFSRPSEPYTYAGATLKYCWGDKGTTVDGFAPALEITTYYLESGVYKVARAVLDPNSGRTSSNSFTVATSGTCTVDGQEFQFYGTIGLPTVGLQYATAKILYNTTTAHKVAIDGTGLGFFPSQGSKIISDGSYGDANRKLEVFQLHPIAPPVFANAIFSATGITK